MHLTSTLEQFYLDRDYDGAGKELKQDVHKKTLDSDGMDVIATIFNVALRTAYSKEEVEHAQSAIYHVVSSMSPKEALMSLLEQIEVVDVGNKLYVVLDSLRLCLEKLAGPKWDKHFTWVLSVISKRFKTMKLPSQLQQRTRVSSKQLASLENKELLEDVYEPVQNFLKFYEFCFNTIKLLSKSSEPLESYGECILRLKLDVLSLLAFPLGHCPFDYTWEPSEESGMSKRDWDGIVQETKASDIARSITRLLHQLGLTCGELYQCLDARIDEVASEKLNEKYELLEKTHRPPRPGPLATASYFYVTLNLLKSERKPLNGPYSPTYTFSRSMHLVSELVVTDDPESQFKALSVCYSSVQIMCPHTSYHRLESGFLSTNIHSNFLWKLCELFTYSEDASIRRLGAKVFQSYIWSFEAVGRFNIIKELVNSSCEDTVIGFVITQIKDFVNQALYQLEGKSTCLRLGQEEYIFPQMGTFFTRKNLQALILMCMKTRLSGPIDLISSHARVLSTLNLLRFLFLRDSKSNLSGIKQMAASCTDFLNQVRHSLDMCILQAKGKLNELDNPDNAKKVPSHVDFSLLDTRGSSLGNPDSMTVDECKESCKRTLSQLDMIECVLAHTNQCFAAASVTT